MYKHLTPKKDQLFRRQVKQAFEQRQKTQTSKQTDRQTNKTQSKKPTLPMATAEANTETFAVINLTKRVTAACAGAVKRMYKGQAVRAFTSQNVRVQLLQQSEIKK